MDDTERTGQSTRPKEVSCLANRATSSLWTFFWSLSIEVTRVMFDYLHHQPAGFNQHEVCVLVVSMLSPSSTWVGCFGFC